MTILALDSAGKTASVCVLADNCVRAHVFLDAGYTHSTTLLPMVDAALRLSGVPLSAVDRLAVSHGPGSFTGLRIGIGTVKGLAMATGKPCVPVSTLLAMAHGRHMWQGLVCTAMDARAGQVYAAVFRTENGAPRRLWEDDALPAAEMAAWLDGRTESVLLSGDGGPLIRAAMQKPAELDSSPQTAVGVALAALEGEAVPGERLLPLYLRRPQAEREWEKK